MFASWRLSRGTSPRHHGDPALAHWPTRSSRHSDRPFSSARPHTRHCSLAAKTLLDWVERRAATVPDRVAVSIGETRLSYAELHRRAASLAAFFHELGIGRGDVVAAQLPNGLEFLLTYLAAGYVGASLQTLHMPYRAAELELLLRHGGAKAVVCLAQIKDFAPARWVLGMRERLRALAHVVAVGEDAPAGADFAPPAAPIAIGGNQQVSRAFIAGFEAHWGAVDLNTHLNHPTPAVQLFTVVGGVFSITVTDGETRQLHPGDVVQLEDTTPCKGHITVVGDKPGFLLFAR
jgi:non-ribosomal peptide synthetase component F